MGQAEDRVTEIEEHVGDLVSDAAGAEAGAIPAAPDSVAALRGTEYIEAELRRLRGELLGLRAETAAGINELRARLDRLEHSAGLPT